MRYMPQWRRLVKLEAGTVSICSLLEETSRYGNIDAVHEKTQTESLRQFAMLPI